MTTAGRPKQYRNAAEKQRAYRERRKAEKQQMDDAMAVLAVVKRKVVTLRKQVESWRKEQGGKQVFIDSSSVVTVHRVMVDRHVRICLEDILFQYMLMTGFIEFTGKRHWDHVYEFTSAFNELEMD